MKIVELHTSMVSKSEDGFICSATVVTGCGCRVTMLGHGDNLKTAEEQALVSVIKEVGRLTSEAADSSHHQRSNRHERFHQNRSANQGHRTQTEDKSRFNGGGAKQASEKQRNLIEQLAEEKRHDADALCRGQFGLRLDQLTGAQANQLIQSLK